MSMEKKGAPNIPQVGKVAVPWPSGVLVFKAQEGAFVPQPQVGAQICPVENCGGSVMLWPDGREQCQKCLRWIKP